jgi:putative transposase
MILRNEEECRGEGKAQRSGDQEIIGALKQLEAGRTAEDVGREMGVSKHTIYAWKAKFGLEVSEAQRLRQLEDENHFLSSRSYFWRAEADEAMTQLQSV